MNSQQLIQEGWQLARPCLLLNEASQDETIIAVWGGPGIIAAPLGPFEHIISVACGSLPQNPQSLTGWLSVYRNRHSDNSGVVMVGPHHTFSTSSSKGVRLSGRQTLSFPPIDAVARKPAVRDWLAVNGWEHDPRNQAYFEDDAYNAVFQEHSPLYSEQAVAVLGGWHFPWPDNDWDDLAQHTLIVWTLRDAEPWIEVLMSPQGQYEVRERIT